MKTKQRLNSSPPPTGTPCRYAAGRDLPIAALRPAATDFAFRTSQFDHKSQQRGASMGHQTRGGLGKPTRICPPLPPVHRHRFCRLWSAPSLFRHLAVRLLPFPHHNQKHMKTPAKHKFSTKNTGVLDLPPSFPRLLFNVSSVHFATFAVFAFTTQAVAPSPFALGIFPSPRSPVPSVQTPLSDLKSPFRTSAFDLLTLFGAYPRGWHTPSLRISPV
jgi:hypothetical protein